MNRIFKTFIYATLGLVMVSCMNDNETSTKTDRSVQYFPNMYRSAGYETYQEAEIFPGNVEAQKPVEGTISRGWMPYDYENNNEGYASAKANLNNPLPYTEANLAKGKELYDIYCAVCHGTSGNGKGILVKNEKILGVPSYDSREITQGSIYHVMYYGINTMGSYASQTSIEERWQIAHHVDALTRDLKGEEKREFVNGDDAGKAPVMEAPADETQQADSNDTDNNSTTTEGE